MDGSALRRDGFLIVIENYGGDLLQPQMDWITSDLAGVTGTVVPFLHHNPMGSYKPNGVFAMSDWIKNKIWKWITTGDISVQDGQTWNTKSTGQFLLQKYQNAPIVFCGHNHKDAIEVYQNTVYKITTCAGGASTEDYWGYALVQVENSKIVNYLYSSDPNYQSIPTGHLQITYSGAKQPTQKAIVQSGLSKSYDVTLEFTMPAAGSYTASNGTIVQIAPINALNTRVWVRATTLVAANIQTPKSVEVTVSALGVVSGSLEIASGPTAGTSCGAPISRGNETGHLLLTLLPIGILLLVRRKRSA
jgi:hypothetical protein